jgi:transposase
MSQKQVIENYRHLWQIERAFRISKTDLRIRPVYHRLPRRIEAHIIIAFCAYKLYMELERQLKVSKSSISAEKALDLMKSIYKISVKMPKSGRPQEIIFAEEKIQQDLMKLFIQTET